MADLKTLTRDSQISSLSSEAQALITGGTGVLTGYIYLGSRSGLVNYPQVQLKVESYDSGNNLLDTFLDTGLIIPLGGQWDRYDFSDTAISTNASYFRITVTQDLAQAVPTGMEVVYAIGSFQLEVQGVAPEMMATALAIPIEGVKIHEKVLLPFPYFAKSDWFRNGMVIDSDIHQGTFWRHSHFELVTTEAYGSEAIVMRPESGIPRYHNNLFKIKSISGAGQAYTSVDIYSQLSDYEREVLTKGQLKVSVEASVIYESANDSSGKLSITTRDASKQLSVIHKDTSNVYYDTDGLHMYHAVGTDTYVREIKSNGYKLPPTTRYVRVELDASGPAVGIAGVWITLDEQDTVPESPISYTTVDVTKADWAMATDIAGEDIADIRQGKVVAPDVDWNFITDHYESLAAADGQSNLSIEIDWDNIGLTEDQIDQVLAGYARFTASVQLLRDSSAGAGSTCVATIAPSVILGDQAIAGGYLSANQGDFPLALDNWETFGVANEPIVPGSAGIVMAVAAFGTGIWVKNYTLQLHFPGYQAKGSPRNELVRFEEIERGLAPRQTDVGQTYRNWWIPGWAKPGDSDYADYQGVDPWTSSGTLAAFTGSHDSHDSMYKSHNSQSASVVKFSDTISRQVALTSMSGAAQTHIATGNAKANIVVWVAGNAAVKVYTRDGGNNIVDTLLDLSNTNSSMTRQDAYNVNLSASFDHFYLELTPTGECEVGYYAIDVVDVDTNISKPVENDPLSGASVRSFNVVSYELTKRFVYGSSYEQNWVETGTWITEDLYPNHLLRTAHHLRLYPWVRHGDGKVIYSESAGTLTSVVPITELLSDAEREIFDADQLKVNVYIVTAKRDLDQTCTVYIKENGRVLHQEQVMNSTYMIHDVSKLLVTGDLSIELETSGPGFGMLGYKVEIDGKVDTYDKVAEYQNKNLETADLSNYILEGGFQYNPDKSITCDSSGGRCRLFIPMMEILTGDELNSMAFGMVSAAVMPLTMMLTNVPEVKLCIYAASRKSDGSYRILDTLNNPRDNTWSSGGLNRWLAPNSQISTRLPSGTSDLVVDFVVAQGTSAKLGVTDITLGIEDYNSRTHAQHTTTNFPYMETGSNVSLDQYVMPTPWVSTGGQWTRIYGVPNESEIPYPYGGGSSVIYCPNDNASLTLKRTLEISELPGQINATCYIGKRASGNAAPDVRVLVEERDSNNTVIGAILDSGLISAPEGSWTQLTNTITPDPLTALISVTYIQDSGGSVDQIENLFTPVVLREEDTNTNLAFSVSTFEIQTSQVYTSNDDWVFVDQQANDGSIDISNDILPYVDGLTDCKTFGLGYADEQGTEIYRDTNTFEMCPLAPTAPLEITKRELPGPVNIELNYLDLIVLDVNNSGLTTSSYLEFELIYEFQTETLRTEILTSNHYLRLWKSFDGGNSWLEVDKSYSDSRGHYRTAQSNNDIKGLVSLNLVDNDVQNGAITYKVTVLTDFDEGAATNIQLLCKAFQNA